MREVDLCISGGSIRSIVASGALCNVLTEFGIWNKIQRVESVSGSAVFIGSLMYWRKCYPEYSEKRLIRSISERIVRRLSSFDELLSIQDSQLCGNTFPEVYGRIIANLMIGDGDMVIGNGFPKSSKQDVPELILCAVSGLFNHPIDVLSLILKITDMSSRYFDFMGWVEFREAGNRIFHVYDQITRKRSSCLPLESISLSEAMGIAANVFRKEDLYVINALILFKLGKSEMIPQNLISRIHKIETYNQSFVRNPCQTCQKKRFPVTDAGFYQNIPFISASENYRERHPNNVPITILVDMTINSSGLKSTYQECLRNQRPFPYRHVRSYIADNHPNTFDTKLFYASDEDWEWVDSSFSSIPMILYIPIPKSIRYSSLKIRYTHQDLEEMILHFRKLFQNLSSDIIDKLRS